MDFTLIFILLDKHNCYSLIGKIYNEAYKDKPAELKALLDALIKCCDDFNYKKNKGNLNIEGLCQFVCHKVMDNNDNMKLFNEYMAKVCNKEVQLY